MPNLKPHQQMAIDEFRKILGIIESDYLYMTRDGGTLDPAILDWDIYRLILRTHANINLSPVKALEMNRHISKLISIESPDFSAATADLFTHFINAIQKQ